MKVWGKIVHIIFIPGLLTKFSLWVDFLKFLNHVKFFHKGTVKSMTLFLSVEKAKEGEDMLAME